MHSVVDPRSPLHECQPKHDHHALTAEFGVKDSTFTRLVQLPLLQLTPTQSSMPSTSQIFPVQGLGLKLLIPSVHIPLLKQGSRSHSSFGSTSQNLPVRGVIDAQVKLLIISVHVVSFKQRLD